MSGLQLATKAAAATPDAPTSAPPPLPPPGPQDGDLGSHTQETYSLPPPGASPVVGSTPPPPPPPPLPPPSSALPGQAEVVEPGQDGGSKVGVGLAVILVLAVLGVGGWYLYQHSGLFTRGAVRQQVTWPALQLTGMVDAQNIGDASSAILNGNLVALNHRIDGVTLVEVSSDGVVLELNGERKTIRIGESTE